jgi:hypothetical protein
MTPGTIPKTSKALGMERTPMPIWDFNMSTEAAIQPTCFACQHWMKGNPLDHDETNIAVIGSVCSNLSKDIVCDLNVAGLGWTAGDGLFQVAVLSGIPHFRVDLHGRCGIVAVGTDLTN